MTFCKSVSILIIKSLVTLCYARKKCSTLLVYLLLFKSLNIWKKSCEPSIALRDWCEKITHFLLLYLTKYETWNIRNKHIVYSNFRSSNIVYISYSSCNFIALYMYVFCNHLGIYLSLLKSIYLLQDIRVQPRSVRGRKKSEFHGRHCSSGRWSY